MAKGADFEREICKALSMWWTQNDNPRDDIFWRSSGSGARATTRAKYGKTTSNSNGDMTVIDPCGQPFIDYFLIEMKRGYSDDVKILSIVDGKGKIALFDFWQQAEKDREASGRKESILIFKRDRKKICVMFSRRLYRRISNTVGDWDIKHEGPRIQLWGEKDVLNIVSFDAFFKWFRPEIMDVW